MRSNILNKNVNLNNRLIVTLRNSGTIIEILFIIGIGGLNNG